jgi:hypothetical protein
MKNSKLSEGFCHDKTPPNPKEPEKQAKRKVGEKFNAPEDEGRRNL